MKHLSRVLCAVDFSTASQAAARAALRLAKRGHCQVPLMHVVPAPGTHQPLQDGWLVTHAYYRDLGADALDKRRSLIPPPDRASAPVQSSLVTRQQKFRALRGTRAHRGS